MKMLWTCFSTVDSVTHNWLRDAGVGSPLRHQRQHFALARGEVLERIFGAARSDQLLDQERVHDRRAADDPPQRRDELVDVGDAAFEQVAAALAAREQVGRLLHLGVGGEHDDRRLGHLRADRAGGIEPFRRMGGRHADVEDHEVRAMTMGEREQRGGIAGLVDDPEALVREQPRQPLAKEDVVLGDQDTRHVCGHVRIIDGGGSATSSARGEDCG